MISIHALREEGDCTRQMVDSELVEFLSTPSARRATLQCLVTWSSHRYFYPRPPRGGRRSHSSRAPLKPEISIHALREEGDLCKFALMKQRTDFYPRPPRGGRPVQPEPAARCRYFYPRPPRGGRQAERRHQPPLSKISIHALREEGDNLLTFSCPPDKMISIHALREEGDSKNRDKISIFKQIIQHSARI